MSDAALVTIAISVLGAATMLITQALTSFSEAVRNLQHTNEQIQTAHTAATQVLYEKLAEASRKEEKLFSIVRAQEREIKYVALAYAEEVGAPPPAEEMTIKDFWVSEGFYK